MLTGEGVEPCEQPVGSEGPRTKKPQAEDDGIRWVKVTGGARSTKVHLNELERVTDVDDFLNWSHGHFQLKVRQDALLLYKNETALAGKFPEGNILLREVPGGRDSKDYWCIDVGGAEADASGQAVAVVRHLILDQEADCQKLLELMVGKYRRTERFEEAHLSRSPFYFRTQERQKAFKYLLDQWQMVYETEPRDRLRLMALGAAPGSGKTHLASLVCTRGKLPGGDGIIDEEWQGAFRTISDTMAGGFKAGIQNAVGIMVTFNSGSEPLVEEDPAFMVGVRMLFSHFCRDSFVEFFRLLKQHGCECVTPTRALGIIRQDMTDNGHTSRHIILVVDETLAAVERYKGADYSAHLGTLCSSVGCLIDTFKHLHVLMTSLSGEALRDAVTPKSKRPIDYVQSFELLSNDAIDHLVRAVNSEDQRIKLQSPHFRAVIDEVLGLPRLLEAVFQVAKRGDITAETPCDTVRALATNHFAIEGKYPDRGLRADALLAALAFGCANSPQQWDRAKRAQMEGYLLGDRIPPLVLRWWAKKEQLPGEGRFDAATVILRAAGGICTLSGVRGPAEHGPSFERQFAHALRIATVINADWRRHSAACMPRTVFGYLGADSSFIANEAAPRAMWGDPWAAYNLPLMEADVARLLMDFMPLQRNGDLPPDPTRGMYVPEDPPNAGFDLLLVDGIQGTGEVLVTLVETKFSKEYTRAELTKEVIVEKFYSAFAGRPRLWSMLLFGRLVYIIGCLRSPEAQILEKRHELYEAIAWKLGNGVYPVMVARSLLLMTPEHTRSLFTPTLAGLVPFRDVPVHPSDAAGSHGSQREGSQLI